VNDELSVTHPPQEPAAAAAVRLTIADDLVRRRLTVFFRLILTVPFFIMFVLWAIVALFAALANWVATLVRGTPPASLHRFLAHFVRYVTHFSAYLYLAAERLPAFDGSPGYAVDLEIDPPRRQNRWTVAFRVVLALPAFVLVSVLAGSGSPTANVSHSSGELGNFSLLIVAAILGWFFALAKARMPRGLRDLIAYALSYAAQFWAYLLILTDRYPSSDPLTAIGPLPTRSDPVRMEVRDELRRSRLTVFFRLVLAVPHLVWLTLWGVLALLAAIVSWVATLIAGTSPQWLHRFLSAYVRYQLQVGAYLYLVGNPFPGFVGAEGQYPIDLHVAPRQRQNRWTVFFRLILALPALILAGVFSGLLGAVAFLGWFAALATGRMPLGLRNAGAFALRYTAQASAYLLLVSPAYPYSGPCLEQGPEPDPVTLAEAA
jgi:ABC-type multidrug transport system fused ATPase/permease subunit